MTTHSATASFPRRAFLLVIGLVCLGLALSAGFGYLTLRRLRGEYIRNRGNEIASALDALARGPGRRNNPQVWQSVFAESLPAYSGQVAFIVLLDANRRVLASQGEGSEELFLAPEGFKDTPAGEVYIVDVPLMTPRQGGHAGVTPPITGWVLRIAQFSSSSEWIGRYASIHLAVSLLAIATLCGLAAYLLRIVNRFLQLEKLEQSKRHLAALGTLSATLAHEIRNPLGAMKGLTQLAQEKLPREHEAQPLMQTVIGESERLEQLVSDLLTFARPREISSGRFDLFALLESLRAGLLPQLDAASVKLEIDPPHQSLEIESDENGLRQVLLNVVLNALDVSPVGGTILVRISRTAGAKRLLITVEDRGPGLQGRNVEELFEPFTTSKTRGTGLGLPISRQIVQRLGGSITLADAPGGGAQCRIELPLKEK